MREKTAGKNVEKFRKVFGRKCLVFGPGNVFYWMSNRTLDGGALGARDWEEISI